MDYKNFTNCLRFVLVDDGMSDEKIEKLVSSCKENGYDNVMLFLNAETFNRGHITIDEAKDWVELLKKAAARLREEGISVSLNNWMEAGHGDRMIPHKKEHNFTYMVDHNGKTSHDVACPMDENWQNYFFPYLEYIVKELKPDTYWVEDDFRLHNHGGLDWGGCFCEKHMAEYNKRLNKNYTREEFVKKIFEKGKCNEERKVWLEVSRDCLLDVAEKINAVVKKASPETDIGLMTSAPESHCMEGREWEKLFSTLCKDGHKIDRINLPTYIEITGKEYCNRFNSKSMAVRAFLDDDTIVLPEMENAIDPSVHTKSPKFFRYMLESSIPLCLSGMTYSIFGFHGNGIVDYFGYNKAVKELKPYLQAVKDTGIRYKDLTGVIVPIDEKASYNKEIVNEFRDLMPNDFMAGGYLSSMGVNFKFSTEKSFKNKTVVLFGDNMDNFTNEQIIDTFKNNFVYLDGSGVLKLNERGLSDLISLKEFKIYYGGTAQSYEECATGELVCGLKRFRGGKSFGKYVSITYNDNVEIKANVYDSLFNVTGNGFAVGKGFAIWPYVIDKNTDIIWKGLCNELVRHNFITTLLEQKNPLIVCEYQGISPYLYDCPDKKVVIITNSTLENYEKIKCKVHEVDFEKVYAVEKSGQTKEISFTRVGDEVEFDTELAYLSTVTLILK